MRVGERIESRRTLSAESIATFAELSGDHNPIHHDPRYAAGTRLGGIVASGPQLSSLLMGLSATRFSRDRAMLGLDFRFRFRRPVPADCPISIWWEVVAVRASAALDGDVALLAGKITREDGVDAVVAVGKVLVTDRL